MSRFGKKMVAVGVWAGIGVLVGMQFGSSGGTASSPVPGWSVISGGVQNTAPVSQPQAGTVTGLQVQSDGRGGYVYVPVTLAPSAVPQAQPSAAPAAQQPAAGASSPPASLPQLPAGNYSTLTPGQILVPGEHKSTVDTLADKTAGMLQNASQKGIRWVVSLFDSTE
ncbi:hypothetical protein SAMN04487895_109225 [Paenibacillus sophorae]|uniref:Uncharacterized protein n=1 Tax=Paenibacillus sophorae TaxID=1333845 RepID=A0A1H8RBA9_9BACL|nr:hypothetical protein [Paenibacillus sophorae]QWU15021.1 hypothetical protein KP014_24450 [Paenibacillus sophorae]SEO63642.1 hypothetical protein SAMN04487895_109225 [Paenibacillus sophorae]